MLIFLLFIIFGSVAGFSFLVFPFAYDRLAVVNEQRQQKFSGNMEGMISRSEARRISHLLVLAPVIFAGVLFVILPEELKLPGLLVGGILGIIFPRLYIRIFTQKIKAKFADQLIDALMIMSSSFRGGLSLVQALESVSEEMPNPIRKEFNTVLGENKMGVSLEEALYHLYNRMPSTAMQQMITAILLARETGGNLPIIFNRIVTNIRESKKIQQNLDTLTIQGKIQGVVLCLLPIGFGFVVFKNRPELLSRMLESPIGRGMLIYSFFSEMIGVFFIWKISNYKDF